MGEIGAIAPFILLYIYILLVPSIHNTCKDQMLYYSWVIYSFLTSALSGGERSSLWLDLFIQGLSKRFEHLLLWPPRSPDLTPCDVFLWGYVKDNAYKPQSAKSHSSCGANH